MTMLPIVYWKQEKSNLPWAETEEAASLPLNKPVSQLNKLPLD